MSKNKYTIKARSKQGKLLVTEHANGYVAMLRERGVMWHEALKKHWYRLTISEEKSDSGSSAPKRKALKLTVKRNSMESAKRGYDVFSIYEDNKRYNDSVYRNRKAANGYAKDIMDGANSRGGALWQKEM